MVNVDIIKQKICENFGSFCPAALQIIEQESGFNYLAQNPTSGAYGLCQALPASKMVSAGDDFLTNPNTQILWCFDYIRQRYGNANNALAFWNYHHWF